MSSFVRPYVVTRIEATTVCNAFGRSKARTFGLVLASSAISMALHAVAAAQPPSAPSPEELDKVRQVQKDAETMGSWDQQYLTIEQATDNVFKQQGWTSESDQYARSLMRDLGRIPPWKPHERQEAFMGALQNRYTLTDEQRASLNSEIQREAMMVTAKNFRDVLPVAMEVVKTRASGEPFTAEQVQRWSKALKPMMADSIASMQRVTDHMKKDMTPEQRRLLEADVESLTKRHRDMEKMMVRWEAGQWNPTDWGLQDDPIHYSAVAQHAAGEAEKNALVQQAVDGNQPFNEGTAATDESEWDRYVRQFCDKYECTDSQRASAQGILKNCKQEAGAFRNARRDQIAQAEKLIQNADTPAKRKAQQDELQRQLAPIAEIFNRLKARLYEQVLTTEQRKKFPSETPAPAQTARLAPPPPTQAPPPPLASPPQPVPTSQSTPHSPPTQPPPSSQPSPATPASQPLQ